jgi:hypothetical protein
VRRRRDLTPDAGDAAAAEEEEAIAEHVYRRLASMLWATDPPHPLVPRVDAALRRIGHVRTPVAERVDMLIDAYEAMGLGEAARITAEREERQWRETDGRVWLRTPVKDGRWQPLPLVASAGSPRAARVRRAEP